MARTILCIVQGAGIAIVARSASWWASTPFVHLAIAIVIDAVGADLRCGCSHAHACTVLHVVRRTRVAVIACGASWWASTTFIHLAIAIVVDAVATDLGRGDTTGHPTVSIAHQHAATATRLTKAQALVDLAIAVVVQAVAYLR